MKNAPVDVQLYWSLPGPMDFVNRVAAQCRLARCLRIEFPEWMPVSMWGHVKSALRLGRFDDPCVIEVRAGMDLPRAVGGASHFQRDRVSAETLAAMVTPRPQAVVLIPANEGAVAMCLKYAAVFVAASADSKGDVTLVTVADRKLEHLAGKNPNDVTLGFNGALTKDEMTAYVALRMVARPGPYNTKLFRSLVVEFAGYDAWLAEQLVEMSDAELLALPDSLSRLLDITPERWSTKDWAHGTVAMFEGKMSAHTLHDWYRINHKAGSIDQLQKEMEQRYWRASLQTIFPWLEELRRKMLQVFEKPIDEAIEQQGGRLVKKISKDREILLSRDELEFGNIVGMAYDKQIRIPPDDLSQACLTLCHFGKKVRDRISHMSKPDPDNLQRLLSIVEQFDGLYATSPFR